MTVRELGDGCDASVGDVAREVDCRRAVERCVERFGRIDVMAARRDCRADAAARLRRGALAATLRRRRRRHRVLHSRGGTCNARGGSARIDLLYGFELAPRYLATIPLGRFGQPEDVADAVAWLASEEAAYITGYTDVIDGGQTLGIPGDLESAAKETT